MNELTIRNELITGFEADFDSTATALASDNSITKTFTVNTFTKDPLDDALLSHDEIGVVYPDGVKVEKRYMLDNTSKVTYGFLIGVIFIDKGNYVDQVMICNNALRQVMLTSNFNFQRFGDWKSSELTPLDINTDNNDNRYIFTGMRLDISLAE